MNIITNNPYRVLGVYANASKKDVLANKSKIQAFMKVGKELPFPLDLPRMLPRINRTSDLINKADSDLSLPADQVKYAQFWFLNLTPIDKIAFNHLFSGNKDEAMKIWAKQDNISSLQNRMVCNLIDGNLQSAIIFAQQLYNLFGGAYLEKLFPTTVAKLSFTDLVHQFIDTLCAEVGFNQLSHIQLYGEWKTYFQKKSIDPTIEQLNKMVSQAENLPSGDSDAQLIAANKLKKDTSSLLKFLKDNVESTDLRYQTAADKVGHAIVNCTIGYFNTSDDVEAAFNAMPLIQYANTIVVGQSAKKHCLDSIATLQKMIDDLPPRSVLSEVQAVMKEVDIYTQKKGAPHKETVTDPLNSVSDYDPHIASVMLSAQVSSASRDKHVLEYDYKRAFYIFDNINEHLIKGTKQHLRDIRDKLGQTDTYYLQLSSKVVGLALNDIIEWINTVQQAEEKYSKSSDYERRMYGMYDFFVSKMPEIDLKAWELFRSIQYFDMDPDVQQYYQKNMGILDKRFDDLANSAKTTPTPPRQNDGCLSVIVILMIIFTLGAIL